MHGMIDVFITVNSHKSVVLCTGIFLNGHLFTTQSAICTPVSTAVLLRFNKINIMKKASEVISEIQKLIELHGDLPVLTQNPDSYFGELVPSESVSFMAKDPSRNYYYSYHDGFVLD